MAHYKRPEFPKRIVITAGMPNGNKPLHIGHVGAIFLWADAYARYMRDNIGNENVIFVSGTDGFGSVAEEKYRKLREAGEYDGTIADYVGGYHEIQKNTLKKYGVSLNLFAASCFGKSYEHHKKMSDYFFETMLKNGYMEKKTGEQFYDKDADMILNGRQVEGKCPIDGCKSEVGYADECSLGHQYSPSELIDPVSTLTGKKPEMIAVNNYYLRLEAFREEIRAWCDKLEKTGSARKFMIRDMRDFLQPPMLFISESAKDEIDKITGKLPTHSYFHDEKNKRVQLKFASVEERDKACGVLKESGIRYRSNKTLAPFRISGNAKWGIPLPAVPDGSTDGLTFYVWPESLWAPISFTDTYLSGEGERTGEGSGWRDWWCEKDAKVVQFIGEDNVFFYCLAQTGLFLAMQGKDYGIEAADGKLNLTYVAANKHLLTNNAKASSSGVYKAPTADSLLEHYTVEQLRMHFLGQGISTATANFRSKVFSPEECQKGGDPVLLQGNILTNIFNRIVRSVFYSLQQYFGGKLPSSEYAEKGVKEGLEARYSTALNGGGKEDKGNAECAAEKPGNSTGNGCKESAEARYSAALNGGECAVRNNTENGCKEGAEARYSTALKPSEDAIDRAAAALEKYEEFFAKYEFNNAVGVIDEYFRSANQYWAEKSKTDDLSARARLIADTVHVVKTGVLMLHALAPDGAELVAEYMNAGNRLFDWNNALKTFDEVCPDVEGFRFIEPRFDFFKKHESQLGT
ncbi:MAG: class I tRNA ligase family protein [Clostridiales bacterium]|jgi:methionyl-tRNA synthetase|nr:class I tRNA ligase family protein [Clostridiales bacterium]